MDKQKPSALDKEKLVMYVANCHACLLATAMKTCPLCNFNIGLSVTPEQLEEMRKELNNGR